MDGKAVPARRALPTRRAFLARVGTGGSAAVGALAVAGGCLDVLGGGRGGLPAPPPAVADPPAAVYRPTHAPRVFRVGTADAGDYRVALLVTLPVRFWTLSGTRRSRHGPGGAKSLHVMAAVWDPETGTALPESGVTLELADAGEFVAEEVVYPMVGQGSGFHFGDNFALPGSGTYRIRVGVAPLGLRRTGALRGRFESGGSTTFEFDFEADRVRGATYEPIADAGAPGAIELGPLAHPPGRAPPVDALPGRTLAETTIDSARYVATLLDDPPDGVDPGTGGRGGGDRGGDEESDGESTDESGGEDDGESGGEGDGVDEGDAYLAVSARTPHNRLALPTMGLRVRVGRDGETVVEGRTERTIDPDLGYHYGRTVPPLRSGDDLTLSVTVPPQVARHEGYETAFVGPAETSVTLS